MELRTEQSTPSTPYRPCARVRADLGRRRPRQRLTNKQTKKKAKEQANEHLPVDVLDQSMVMRCGILIVGSHSDIMDLPVDFYRVTNSEHDAGDADDDAERCKDHVIDLVRWGSHESVLKYDQVGGVNICAKIAQLEAYACDKLEAFGENLPHQVLQFDCELPRKVDGGDYQQCTRNERAH